MRASSFTSIALAFLSFRLVAGHGALTQVKGANGINAAGFGILASTPRTGSSPNPFEQDTSVIRDNAIKTGKTDVCGSTKAGGNNDVATQLAAAETAGLPSMDASGTVNMVLHQVNQDGAGPYTCEISTDGTGANFVKMDVTQNVPGFLSLSTAKATDFNLVATAPAGTTCSGGSTGTACLVRCRNNALAGPFGGCVAVTDASGGTTGTTATTNSTVNAVTGGSAPAGKRPIKSRIVGRALNYWV
ncbi:hypothetical protein DL93DRAFT_2172026 [Clavulina sp. PMI_390]|nr:hypothetical protein DL93DRAFT_2172026 [Clavulina sp. PMI_390]